MAQEIELKLSLPTDAISRFAAHPLLQQLALPGSYEQRQLGNTYFDTPQRQLQRHRVALRIRQDGDRFIQTLKTRGTSEGGLHQRGEWEWLLAEDAAQIASLNKKVPALNIELLPAAQLPPQFDPAQLQPLFTTDFQRQSWQLQYPDSDSLVELVLDQGEVRLPALATHSVNNNAPRRDVINEVELELLQGDPVHLFQLALQLTTELPLRITRISKAERGYRLLGEQQPPPPLHPSPATATLASRLEALQQAMEQFEFSRQVADLPPLVSALQDFSHHAGTVVNGPSLCALQACLQQIALQYGAQQQQAVTDITPPITDIDNLLRQLQQQPLCLELLQWAYHCYCSK